MKIDIRDPGSVRVLRPLEVASYLRASGWTQVQAKEGQFAIWALGEDHEALLPLQSDTADYALRMGQSMGR